MILQQVKPISIAAILGAGGGVFVPENNYMPRQPPTAIYSRIKHATESARLPATQRDIGRLVGVSQPAVHEWSTGKSVPSLETVISLALRLNVCVEWIYTGRGSMRPTIGSYSDPISVAMREVWGQLNPTSRSEVLRAARQWHALQDALNPQEFAQAAQGIEETGAHRALPAPSELPQLPAKDAKKAE